jgi:hypothetical protein
MPRVDSQDVYKAMCMLRRESLEYVVQKRNMTPALCRDSAEQLHSYVELESSKIKRVLAASNLSSSVTVPSDKKLQQRCPTFHGFKPNTGATSHGSITVDHG